MDHKEKHHLRLHILASLFFAVMALYLGVLYDTQITNYEYYHARSIRDITRSEPVEAARGDLTDRNGEVLVSSRPSYDLTFDASLLREDQDAGEAVLRLLELCRDQGITWEDDLPITRTAPLSYTLDALDDAAKSRFLTYLKDLDETADALGAYLLDHPALLETVDEDGERENPADDILEDEDLVFYLRPLRRNASFLVDIPAESVPDFDAEGGSVVRLNGVDIIPQYRIPVRVL